MSLLNGFSGLASGLAGFGANAVRDAPTSAAAPTVSKSLEPARPSPAPTSPGAASEAVARTNSASPMGVSPDLLSIYQAASKRTGVPLAILLAQGKQESDFDPNAVGKAGEIGIMQIKPSTAAQPGFGMKGIDPATLKDPAININFAADYLRARGGGPGVDFSNPASVDRALAAYNSGGDPNYVANVRSHMGAS